MQRSFVIIERFRMPFSVSNMGRRRTILWLTSSVMAIAIAAMLPSAAHASCGDYVSIASDLNKQSRESPLPCPCTGNPERLPGQPPCQGPFCTGSHLPMPVAPVFAQVIPHDAGLLGTVAASLEHDTSLLNS